jgi:hypothetical protein
MAKDVEFADLAKGKSCPVDGCKGHVPPEQYAEPNTILCPEHWAGLPERYRADIAQATERLRQRGNSRWQRLKHNALLLARANAIKAAGREPEDPADQPA